MPRGTDSDLPGANKLLAALPADESERLLPHWETVVLEIEQVLWRPGEAIPHVHFPAGAVIATVVPMRQGGAAEAGMVGSEGMVCLCTLLGCDTTPFRAVVENPGEALRVSVREFAAAVAGSDALRGGAHRYADAFLAQVSQSAACNALHTLEQRCCRWLLMTHDRAGPDRFLLTQEFIAQKMGAKRTSVTEVAKGLQGRGLIRYSRGKVTIRDRAGLEAIACECYRKIRAKYDALPGCPAGPP